MNNNFRGWKPVYSFTFRQATKGVGFKLVTVLFAILIMGAFILMNVLMAKPAKDKNSEPSPIKKVFILDNSGLQPTNYKDILDHLQAKQFKHIDFVTAADKSGDEVIKTAAKTSSETIAVIITAEESGYLLQGYIPAGSTIKKKHTEALLKSMSSAFESNKLLQVGLSAQQLTSVLKPTVTSYSEIGESTSEAAKFIKIFAPMIFSFILYFMLLIYGQNISKSVSTEKTSKLMETLLISVHPYALITGKVLAITSMALIQFVTWLVAGAVGLYGGNAVAHAIYPEYENTVVTIINFLKDNIGETAMTVPAVILAIIIFCLGFLFYNMIAALAGCMVSKPEDVANTQSIFLLPIVISWLVSYFPPMMGKDGLVTVTRYIPFTSPFTVPVALITGSIGLVEGLISMFISLIFCLLIVILGGRIYKGLVLYNGQKLSFKLIGNILKSH